MPEIMEHEDDVEFDTTPPDCFDGVVGGGDGLGRRGGLGARGRQGVR